MSNPQHPRLLAQLVTDSGGIIHWPSAPMAAPWRAAANANTGGEGAIWLWDVSSPAHPRPLGQPLSPERQAVDRERRQRRLNQWRLAQMAASWPAEDPYIKRQQHRNKHNTIQLWDVSNPEHPRPLGQRDNQTGGSYI